MDKAWWNLLQSNSFSFSEILKVMLPKITAQYESLRPNFRKIDRMEDLVTRVSADFDVLGSKLILKSTKLPTGSEKQLDDAENTIVEGTLRNVLKMPLNLLNKQLSVTEVLQMFTTFTYNLNLKYFHLCKTFIWLGSFSFSNILKWEIFIYTT